MAAALVVEEMVEVVVVVVVEAMVVVVEAMEEEVVVEVEVGETTALFRNALMGAAALRSTHRVFIRAFRPRSIIP